MKLSFGVAVALALLSDAVSATVYGGSCRDTCAAKVAAFKPAKDDYVKTHACQSFLKKTVSPQPTTKTVFTTKYLTVTQTTTKSLTTFTTSRPLKTSSITESVAETESTTRTDTDTETETKTETDTVDVSITVTDLKTTTTTDVVRTDTVTQTATVSTSTSTSFSTYNPWTTAVAKRGVSVSLSSTAEATVPSWARGSCGSDKARFSSACSCAGYTRGATVTLTRSTATKTSTISKTVTTTLTNRPQITSTVRGATSVIEQRTTTTNTVLVTVTSLVTLTKTNTAKTSISVTETFETTLTGTQTDVATITETNTISRTATATATVSVCGNQGFEYAFWDYNGEFGEATQYYWEDVDPTVYKTRTPKYSGVASSIGFDTNNEPDDPLSRYDSPDIGPEFFVVNHVAYLIAPEDGEYTFSIRPDDTGMVWVEEVAREGWARENALLDAQYPDSAEGFVSLTKGEALPFRVFLIQNRFGAILDFTITSPSGTVLLGKETGFSDDIVRWSCDGRTLRPFAPWGSEL